MDDKQNPASDPQNNLSPVTSPPTPITPTVILPSFNPATPNKPHKKAFAIAIIVLVLLLAGGSAFAFYHAKHDRTITKPAAISSSKKVRTTPDVLPATTDAWTGKGTTDNWSDSANWSAGVPQNNANLTFNITFLTAAQETDQQGDVPSNNDLSNLTLHTITFTGSRSANDSNVASYEITGSSFSVSDGITNNSSIEATINPTITLTHNQIFGGSPPSNGQPYNKIYIGSLLLSNYSVTFATSVGVQGSISGTGSITVSNKSGDDDADFSTDSPQYTGQLTIDSGSQAEIDASSTTAQPFGTAKLVIDSGGQLLVDGTTVTLGGDLTIGGSGLGQFSLNTVSSSNPASGAIEVCATTLNITGETILSSDTTFGGCVSGPGPHAVNVSGTLTKNTYTISAIPDTQLALTL